MLEISAMPTTWKHGLPVARTFLGRVRKHVKGQGHCAQEYGVCEHRDWSGRGSDFHGYIDAFLGEPLVWITIKNWRDSIQRRFWGLHLAAPSVKRVAIVAAGAEPLLIHAFPDREQSSKEASPWWAAGYLSRWTWRTRRPAARRPEPCGISTRRPSPSPPPPSSSRHCVSLGRGRSEEELSRQPDGEEKGQRRCGRARRR